MFLEIELPDGTVLDAPDGADVKQVVRGYKLSKLKAEQPEEYDPQSEEYGKKYGTETSAPVSFFSGVKRMDAGMGNLAQKYLPYSLPGLLAKLHPERYTDKALKQEDVDDTALKEQHPVARFGGEAAGAAAVGMATAPIEAPAVGAGILLRTLGHPTTRAALEGVVPAMAASDPEEQAKGGGTGAVLSGLMERLFKGGGRLVKGLVQKSDAAKDLEQLAAQHGEEIFTPLSQAAGDQDAVTRLAKTGYQEGLSLIPGVKGKLARQAADAESKVREIALREAAPTGSPLPNKAGENVADAVNTIEDSISREYADTVKSYAFNVPETLADDVSAAIKKAIPNIDDTTTTKMAGLVNATMTRFSSGKGVIDGENLIKVRDVLARAKVQPEEAAALKVAQKQIDNLIESELSQGSSASNLRDLARFKDLAEPERQFAGVKASANAASAHGGNFSPAQLARNATDPTQKYLGSTANEVLGQPAASSSMAGRIVAGLTIGGYGVFIDPASAAAAFVGGNAMATKVAQKALMGDTRAQKAIQKLIEDNPQIVGAVQRVLRQAAAAQAGESNAGP